MFVGFFGGGVSRAGAFVRGAAFENSDPQVAVGSVGRETGYGWAFVELWGRMAVVLGRTDVQLDIVGGVVGVLGNIAVCAFAFVCITFAGIAEFATHQRV